MRFLTFAAVLLAASAGFAQAPDTDWDKEGRALLDKAVSDDPAVAIPAQDEIREVGRPYVPALRAALKDAKGSVRFFACELLGDLHDASAAADVAGLLGDLVEDRTGEPVAAAAARALGKLGDASVTDALIGALDSKDVNVKYEAIRALGNLRAKKAEGKLIELLKSLGGDKPSEDLTKETFRGGLLPAAACEALGRMKSQAALAEVMKMLDKTVPETRSGWTYDQIAIMALTRITGEDKGAFDGDKKVATVKAWQEWWAKQPKQPEQPPK